MEKQIKLMVLGVAVMIVGMSVDTLNENAFVHISGASYVAILIGFILVIRGYLGRE